MAQHLQHRALPRAPVAVSQDAADEAAVTLAAGVAAVTLPAGVADEVAAEAVTLAGVEDNVGVPVADGAAAAVVAPPKSSPLGRPRVLTHGCLPWTHS